MKSAFAGFGHYVPERIILNAQMEQWLNLEAGWIERRTGIRARRWVSEGETLVDIAEKASVTAIEHAGLPVKDIGMTILATSTPDRLLPPSAPLLAHRLGLSQSGALDLAGACTGFLYALMMADGYVQSQGKAALVVAANILSRRINLAEQGSAILFGDAAGALVLVPGTKNILGSHFNSDGSGYGLISIAAGGSERPYSSDADDYRMNLSDGQVVYARAVKMMTHCAQAALEAARVEIAEINRFIPHQANLRISNNIAKRLGVALTKTISPICDYGNSSAAGIPLALSISNLEKPLVAGEKILLAAAGAGMTGGALVICI